MKFNLLRLEVADRVAVVTLDRPPVNAMGVPLMKELIRAFDELNDRNDVRVVILTAAGKYFCAGADVAEHSGHVFNPGERWALYREFRNVCEAIRDCRRAVIGAINGTALGSGLCILAMCDILVASETAEVGLPEINVGLVGGARLIQEIFGRSWLRTLAFSGGRLSAPELYRVGIVQNCVPGPQLMRTAQAIAAQVVEKGDAAIRFTKVALNAVEEMGRFQGTRLEHDLVAELLRDEEAAGAMSAFMARRKRRAKDVPEN